MNARPTPRRGSPSAPGSLAGVTEAVAENGTAKQAATHQGCLNSEAAGQASAAGASRHEVRDRGEGRRWGASMAN
jgi:hypothetical protein